VDGVWRTRRSVVAVDRTSFSAHCCNARALARFVGIVLLMKKTGVALCVVVGAAELSACGGAFDTTLLEDRLVQELSCSEFVRPSTVDRLLTVIKDPSVDDIAALLLNPTDLADLVARGGAQLEGAVLLAQNMRMLAETGAGADLLAHGWDGVQCGEPQVIACTAGTVTSTVDCAADAPSSVVLAFDACVLRGTLVDGALQFTRDALEDTAAFDVGIVSDETRLLRGAGFIDVGDADAFTFALTDGFAVVDHGGIASGLSCGAESHLSEAGFDLADSTATITLALAHDTPDKHVAMATTSPVVFDGRCGCPLPGASVVMDVPRPLGRDGQTAHANITWSESDDDNACARATVTLSDWPTDCVVGGDCAKAATASAMTRLLSAFCYVQ
jgi:hypothetical protein